MPSLHVHFVGSSETAKQLCIRRGQALGYGDFGLEPIIRVCRVMIHQDNCCADGLARQNAVEV